MGMVDKDTVDTDTVDMDTACTDKAGTDKIDMGSKAGSSNKENMEPTGKVLGSGLRLPHHLSFFSDGPETIQGRLLAYYRLLGLSVASLDRSPHNYSLFFTSSIRKSLQWACCPNGNGRAVLQKRENKNCDEKPQFK